ncbi:ABC transporter substrate-binding protein [Desulfocurvibacter africanus]|uniref:ABC transporter substrate-binding protein n=1 Tax=Desulfocurvibacter africanus TaxID=873 RepID=UPI003A4DF354
MAIALLTAPAAWAGPVIVDDLGQRVELAAPARRVIPLYSGLGEIVSAMGLGERLVARTNVDNWPTEALARPSIGTHMRPNMELMLGLKPDLVLQLAGRDAALQSVEAVRNHGIPVAVFVIDDFASLFTAMERIGILLGAEDAARQETARIQARLAAVDKAVEGVQRPSVFFEVRYPNLLAAGKDSMVSEIIRRAGGGNVVAQGKKLVRLSEEVLVGLNPEVYLVQQGPMNPAPPHPSGRSHFRTLAAVRSGRVLMVDEALYSRPGPRSVQAVEELATFLHPDRFPKPSSNKDSK